MQTIKNKYLMFIPYNLFDLWDTKRYTSKAIESSYKIVTLGEYIKEENKKYKLFEEEEKEFGILGVNNKEGIFDAYNKKGKDINQPYKKMELGWVAYNPYRINVGSIGIRLKTHKNEYISPAYVVFSCKDNLLPEFLFFIFKTSTFNKIINESTTGSVRQNLTFDILKKLQIPLPTLIEQERIVNAYNQKIKQAQLLEKQAAELEKGIEEYLFEKLGVEKAKEKQVLKGLQFVSYKNILEWGLDKILAKHSNKSEHHHITSISENPELAIEIFRGKSPKYKESNNSFILNQKCNRWNKIDLNFVKKVDESWFKTIETRFFTKEGDILINSTGEGTIGRASFISKEFEGLLYDSHILLLRLNQSIINPELFVEIFNSSYGQNQVNNIKSAQATNQTELGVSNLIKICFPLIDSIETQKSIVEYIKNIRNKIYSLKEQAEVFLMFANKDLEQEIFGKDKNYEYKNYNG